MWLEGPIALGETCEWDDTRKQRKNIKYVGTLEHYRSGQTTMLLQIIAWPAIAISTALLFLLTCVAVATAVRLLRGQP